MASIAIIGADGSGKTTLLKAMARWTMCQKLGKKIPMAPLPPGPLEVTTVGSYWVSDWPDQESAAKGLATETPKFDAYIWVHEAGKTYLAREHLQAAKAAGIKHGVAYINHRDDKAKLDAEDREDVEKKVKAEFANAGFEGPIHVTHGCLTKGTRMPPVTDSILQMSNKLREMLVVAAEAEESG